MADREAWRDTVRATESTACACGRPAKALGLCAAHYRRHIKGIDFGDGTLRRRDRITPDERFWQKVDVRGPGECWPWLGGLRQGGHGEFWDGSHAVQAHRYAYALEKGPIAEGMQADHICHRRDCVNPAHIREATPAQNQQNRKGASKASTTGVRNVFLGRTGRFRVAVTFGGKQHAGGTFDTLAEAEAAAESLRLALFGPIPTIDRSVA